MKIVSQNPTRFLAGFSGQFKKEFLDVLGRRHGSKRVRATKVWNEYIADRHHIHLNSTCWTTLTGFIRTLGREGICKVDQDEEGKWYIQYLYKDPEIVKRQKALAKKERMNEDDDERMKRLIKRQQARAMKMEGVGDDGDDGGSEEEEEGDDEEGGSDGHDEDDVMDEDDHDHSHDHHPNDLQNDFDDGKDDEKADWEYEVN